MKRNTFFKVVMMTMVMISSMNTFGQGRGMNGGGRSMGMDMNRGGRQREMVMSRNGGMEMRREGSIEIRRGGEMPMASRRVEMVADRGLLHDGHGHYFCHDGFLPGWEGRVRFMDGRYGYFRDGAWMWYDTYFEPDFYFGHPVGYFHTHILDPVSRGIVGGVVGGVVLGSLISALCR